MMLPALPRWAWYAIAGAALLLAALAWHWSRVRDAVSDAFSEQRAEVAERTVEAERTANANDTERRIVREVQIRRLEDAVQDAVAENPDETNAVAGPATRAVLDGLRTEARNDSGSAR